MMSSRWWTWGCKGKDRGGDCDEDYDEDGFAWWGWWLRLWLYGEDFDGGGVKSDNDGDGNTEKQKAHSHNTGITCIFWFVTIFKYQSIMVKIACVKWHYGADWAIKCAM